MNLFKNVEILQPSTVIAASTIAKSGFVDMQGFEGCLFILAQSTLAVCTSNVTMRAQMSTAASTAAAVYVEGSVSSTRLGAAGVNYRTLSLDVYRPTKRYVRARFSGTIAGTTLQGYWVAVKYGPKAPGTTAMYDSTQQAGGGVVVGGSS